MIIMTASMTGISSTRLELMPNRVELCGTVKGASVTDTPLTTFANYPAHFGAANNAWALETMQKAG